MNSLSSDDLNSSWYKRNIFKAFRLKKMSEEGFRANAASSIERVIELNSTPWESFQTKKIVAFI